MTTTRKKPKPTPGKPRWRLGFYELSHTLEMMAFSGVAFGVKFITQENIIYLWNQPGWCTTIGLFAAAILKGAWELMKDNSSRKV